MTFFTARQLEDLHKSSGANGQLVLPYRARLSPLAQDWVRARKIKLGYSDPEAPAQPAARAARQAAPQQTRNVASAGAILWWCDGPCGPAKAALAAQAIEANLRPVELPADARKIAEVIKLIAREVKSGQASAGILLVQSAALATVFANRCPSLRAIVGTCLEAVEQGIREAAANVLVIEHPHKTLPQVKSMLARFARGDRSPSDDLGRQLKELSSCV